MEVLMITSRKGTIRVKISQKSIIFMSEVGGSSSILLVKMVVITSMMVRFTARESPKRPSLNEMVTKEMTSRRIVGRYVVSSSVVTFLFSFNAMETMFVLFSLDKVRLVMVNIVRSLSLALKLKKSSGLLDLVIINT